MVISACCVRSIPHSLGGYAYACKAHAPSFLPKTLGMKPNLRAQVAENLRALMIHAEMVNKQGEPNQTTLSKASGVDQRTVGRVLACEQSPTVDLLDKLAAAFNLQSWQLLIPRLDPKNPPVFAITEAERSFYRRLDELRTVELPEHPYMSK